MSLKGLDLREVLVQRLQAAADDIYALFERTFAEYQAEVLRSKLLQRPHVVLYRQDVQTVSVNAACGPEPIKVKQEEKSLLRVSFCSVKTEENANEATPQKSAAEVEEDRLEQREDEEQDERQRSRSDAEEKDSVETRSTETLKAGRNEKRFAVNHRLQHCYSCSECGMKFTQRYTLIRHVRNTHNKERPHTCSFCHKGFFRRYDYVNHMNLHTGERPFSCSLCDKSYRSRQCFNKHKCQSQSVPSTSKPEPRDVQSVGVGADREPTKIKQEEHSDLKILLSLVKTEENVTKSTLQEAAAEENRHNNEPNDSRGERSAKCKEQKVKTGKKSATKSATKKDQPQRFALKSQLRRSFSCSDCGMKFAGQKTLSRHIRNTHKKERPHRCSVCQKGFFRRYDFVTHMRIHTGERPFSCSVCEKGFRCRQSLKDHKCSGSPSPNPPPLLLLRETSDASAFQRAQCDIQTVIVGEDRSPEPIEIKEEEESVTTIDRSSLHKAGVEENREGPGCSVDLRLDDKGHQSSSSDTDNSSDWETMDKVSPAINGEGLKAAHSESPAAENDHGGTFTCHICSRVYTHRGSYMKHLQHHAGDGSFACQICDRVYRHRASYKQHLRIHSAQNPFRCSFCPRVFVKSSRLEEHERIHTGEKPFGCPGCAMRFRLRATRDRHVYNAHDVRKPYACAFCPKAFIEKHRCVNHMRIHTGERPFRCAVCDKRFREKKSLKNHMRTHKDGAEG